MKKLSILLAILLTLSTALLMLPVEKVTALASPTLAPPELYAGSSNPGHVWKYMGGTNWMRISPIYPPLGWAVLSLIEYNHDLYAGVISTDMSSGQVWKYEGGENWTLVGQWMDDQIDSLVVYKGQLYAGTSWNGMRLYRYNDSPGNWTLVVNYTPWHGTRSLYVFNNYLLMGDLGMDYIGSWNGTTFNPSLQDSGSCIYDFEQFGDYVYAAAWQGRMWRSSDGVNWVLAPGFTSYYDGNIWEVESFKGSLFAAYDNGELRASSVPDRGGVVYTAPDGITSMATEGDNLYFGTGGEAGYYHATSGNASIYKYNGTSTTLISGLNQFGAGVQVLYSPEKLVIGYLPTWEPLDAIDGKNLTHVIEAFALVNSNVPGYLSTTDLRKATFVQEAEGKNMVPLVSIKQDGNDANWYTVISDANKRSTLISSIITLVGDFSYKGVDIDLEDFSSWVPKSELGQFQKAYKSFILDLRNELDLNSVTRSPRRLLTVTVQGGSLSLYSIGDLTKAANYVMLMGYDFNIGVKGNKSPNELPLGPWTSQGGGLCIRDCLATIVGTGYPAYRVIYLLPFYARWGGAGQEITWGDLTQTEREFVKSKAMNTYYLEKQVALNITGQQGEKTMWWTDPDCIIAKVRAALFQNSIVAKIKKVSTSVNIGGVGAWQIGQDASDSELTQTLWNAAHGL